jgi:hypothetical protein
LFRHFYDREPRLLSPHFLSSSLSSLFFHFPLLTSYFFPNLSFTTSPLQGSSVSDPPTPVRTALSAELINRPTRILSPSPDRLSAPEEQTSVHQSVAYDHPHSSAPLGLPSASGLGLKPIFCLTIREISDPSLPHTFGSERKRTSVGVRAACVSNMNAEWVCATREDCFVA